MTTAKPFKLLLVLAALALSACTVSSPENGGPSGASSASVTRARAERNQDDSVGRAVLGSLRQSDAAAFKGVSVLAWDGAILLAGAVAKPEHRRRAEQLAKAVDGVRTVHNDLVLDENPAAAAFVPDIAREQRIYAGLLGEAKVSGAYVVRMVDGVATLLGSARSADDVAAAMDFARDADGVKWVVNHVAVK
ncbi:hypothetical protein CU669_12285 [Paramagnetospirillum kuznetsovii]|uniref:BON domain-containing protein n=1 Tax=Paramagnetospirillum kuznetsovii TaxID=2053833 RepID=A0A364NXN3_9PROT|nr:BON domain-containing protein [Paramagnetospirillum kuznetsovii]RAU21740.1 hypothetical protein CU669_12285 [Paramagnetospirillum kuznetsovii]